MQHQRTPYRDIVQDEHGQWITVPGTECSVCGGLWPCSKAGQEAEPGDWL